MTNLKLRPDLLRSFFVSLALLPAVTGNLAWGEPVGNKPNPQFTPFFSNGLSGRLNFLSQPLNATSSGALISPNSRANALTKADRRPTANENPTPEPQPPPPPLPFQPPANGRPNEGASAGPLSITNDNAPVDDEGNLLVDVSFGTKGESAEKQEELIKKRLGAVAFAINSVNTTKTRLLKMDDLMKSVFPPNGKFKKDHSAAAKVKLSNFLTDSQIGTLRTILSKEPLNCAKNRASPAPRNSNEDDQDKTPEAEALRADVITKAILNQKNYYQMLELNNDRRDFERQLGISPEFDVDGDRKDASDKTMRILLDGESGITHPNTQRLLVLQKTESGRLVIRTGDVDKDEASDPKRDFKQHPATARPNASEEIWELPNGMRAYAARNEQGGLITQVPHGLVTKEITNPTTCFECHGGTGFIAGTGKFDAPKHTDKKPLERTKVVDEFIGSKAFGSKNLFRAQWKDYMAEIAPANARFKAATETAGDVGSSGAMSVIQDYNKEVSIKSLAKELNVEDDDLRNILAGARVRSALSPKTAKKEIPAQIQRTTLEKEFDLGSNGDTRIKRPLYCHLKEATSDQTAGLFKKDKDGRAVTGKPPEKSDPRKNTHDVKL